MSNKDPEQLRQEIEHTRSNLSQNVNALGEAVTPGNIARRQVDKVTGTAAGLKDKVMGSAQDFRDEHTGDGPGIGDRASDVGAQVGQLPQQARRQAQGNPLAAGLIALGVGAGQVRQQAGTVGAIGVTDLEVASECVDGGR